MKKLYEINIGDTFKIGPLEFIHLQLFPNGNSAVILKKYWEMSDFDLNTNNYANSYIRKKLNDKFLKLLTKYIAEENIINHTVDLTALDGRTDYGFCVDKISLLTYDSKRKYCHLLYQNGIDINEYIWLATPYSTTNIGYSYDVCCMAGDGTINHAECSETCFGIYPFFYLDSSIMVDD